MIKCRFYFPPKKIIHINSLLLSLLKQVKALDMILFFKKLIENQEENLSYLIITDFLKVYTLSLLMQFIDHAV